MDRPRLTRWGGALLLSDSPEQLRSSDLFPVAMYRDQATGDFRVFYHHQNESSKSVSVGVAITNTSSEPQDVFVRGTGESVNVAPDLAGQAAASRFISSRHNIRFATLLLPRQTYFEVQKVPNGDTASAILEYLLIAAPLERRPNAPPGELVTSLIAWSKSEAVEPPHLPAGFRLGSATISTVAYIGAEPFNPAELHILPSDSHIRGSFAHSERRGAVHLSSDLGLQMLSVDTSAPGGKYSHPMENEYELGTDAVDGGKPVYDDGNYGVIYDLFAAVDSKGFSSNLALLLEPSGGAGHFVVFTDGHQALSPYVTSKSAWWFGDRILRGRQIQIHLQTTLPGGASGPQDFLFDPGFEGRL